MENKKLVWLCELPMKRGILDDDYAFYDDGTVIHEYDLSEYSSEKLNLKEEVTPSNLPKHVKEKIIIRCPEELKKWVSELLRL